MERFRLRVRHEPKKGNVWELHLMPDTPRGADQSASVRLLGSVTTATSINWLRDIARPYLLANELAYDIDRLGPRAEPVWLEREAGMRLALAFTAARYLTKARQRKQFREDLIDLPTEVVLYWFTLCFYGNRMAAARAALRTLLAFEEPPPPRRTASRTDRKSIESAQAKLL